MSDKLKSMWADWAYKQYEMTSSDKRQWTRYNPAYMHFLRFRMMYGIKSI